MMEEKVTKQKWKVNRIKALCNPKQ